MASPKIIDPEGSAISSSQRAEIGQHTPVPKESVLACISRQVRLADHLTTTVHPIWVAESAPKAADIYHFAVLPEERVFSWESSGCIRNRVGIGDSGDLAVVVD